MTGRPPEAAHRDSQVGLSLVDVLCEAVMGYFIQRQRRVPLHEGREGSLYMKAEGPLYMNVEWGHFA